MPDLWLPGVERVTGCKHTGGELVGGPPRVIMHCTWDVLDAQGNPPAFDNVKNYLARVGYEPHLMVDPFTGRIVQFLPFNTSGYAVDHKGSPETNRFGSACIQVEWFFTPNVLRNGARWATLADTPMLGWITVCNIADWYGIPRVWPLGSPTWQANRDPAVWTSQAGYYGHGQVPNQTHTDPGPMPAFPAVRKPNLPPPEADPMLVLVDSSNAHGIRAGSDGYHLISGPEWTALNHLVAAGAPIKIVRADNVTYLDADHGVLYRMAT